MESKLDKSSSIYRSLSEWLSPVTIMSEGSLRLLVIFGGLGDFDSIEYAQKLSNMIPKLNNLGIKLYAIGIGDKTAKEKFCSYTGFPKELLGVVLDNRIHDQLSLSKGLETSFGSWVDLLLMCTGISSPGTLNEVFRGYSGDRNSEAVFKTNTQIKIGKFISFNSRLFDLTGPPNYQRPFEMATLRLSNMVEVITNWRLYQPNDIYLTQRGGTYLFDENNKLIYSFKAKGLLCYALNMANPFQFL